MGQEASGKIYSDSKKILNNCHIVMPFSELPSKKNRPETERQKLVVSGKDFAENRENRRRREAKKIADRQLKLKRGHGLAG